MRTTLKHIWTHLSTHGWPLLAGGFLSGFACHQASHGLLWCLVPATGGIALVVPILVTTVKELSNWTNRESHPNQEWKEQDDGKLAR